MIVKANLKYLRTSPRKVKSVADLIEGKGVDEALAILKFVQKSSSKPLSKLINSAVSNATQKDKKIDADDLVIKSIIVNAGPTLKRWLPRSMGRANRILKRTTHITLVLKDK